MGTEANITADKYPEQGKNLGARVSVAYHYNLDRRHEGTCVRDDMEAPFRTIFQLDNGRFILATECQYSWL